MGYSREIWVVEFVDGNAYRSVYVGEPLVPEYSRFNDHPDETLSLYEKGDRAFLNSYGPDDYLDYLKKAKVWNWAKRRTSDHLIDGPNLDIAFFTKDRKGNDRVCRLMAEETTCFDDVMEQFDKFFTDAEGIEGEKVVLNRKMMERSPCLLPGGMTDKS